jgi:hypothetical protein
MSNYQYFKGSPTETILLKDNGQSACPYVPPMKYPHPTITGQSIMGRIPCTSLCPLVEFDEGNGIWTINCGAQIREFKVTEFQMEEPKSSVFSI